MLAESRIPGNPAARNMRTGAGADVVCHARRRPVPVAVQRRGGDGVSVDFDPLRTEGEAYAEIPAAQGVPVLHRAYPGAIHGFMTMPSLPLGGTATRQVCADIRAIRDRRVR